MVMMEPTAKMTSQTAARIPEGLVLLRDFVWLAPTPEDEDEEEVSWYHAGITAREVLNSLIF